MMQIDPSHYEKATLDQRLIAYVTDIFVCALVIGLFVDLTKSLFVTPHQNTGGFIEITIASLYFIVFTAERGQTIGKMLLKIKVISTDGRKVDYAKSALRFLGYIVNNFTFTLGYLWVAFDKNKQGLHNKIAGTYVIKLK